MERLPQENCRVYEVSVDRVGAAERTVTLHFRDKDRLAVFHCPDDHGVLDGTPNCWLVQGSPSDTAPSKGCILYQAAHDTCLFVFQESGGSGPLGGCSKLRRAV